MTPKEGEEIFKVTACKVAKSGRITASLRWTGAPDHIFRLTLASDGVLTDFLVSSSESTALSSTVVRTAPIGRMHAAVRADVAARADLIRRGNDVNERAWQNLLTRLDPDDPDDAEIIAFYGRDRRAADKAARRFASVASDREDPTERLVATAALYVDLIAAGELRPADKTAGILGVDKKIVQNRLYQAGAGAVPSERLYVSHGQGRLGGRLTKRGEEVLKRMKEKQRGEH